MQWKHYLFLIPVSILFGCVQTMPLRNLASSPAGATVQFFYDSQGGKAEAYLIRPKGDGPFPLIVLLHGDSWVRAGAKRTIPVAEQFSAELCYAGLAISLPGYGMTEIEGDRDKDIIAGVVLDGIAKVRELPWIDKKSVMLYGLSRGAVFAATLVDKIQGLRGVILHSGAYDLGRLYSDTPAQWVRRSLNPNGDANPYLFSVLPEVSRWKAPTLILHGGNDQLVPTNQAFLLRDRLEALGKPYHFAIFPDAGHRLPTEGVREEVISFLTQNVGSACER
ncbi:MAG: prolyl oligopeptidase family serine peptidase [Deltaproteobacteria bacterium]|nr:prolyl oligopeptidase family serine peptidase [Deltaproteobacteria bacterium]